MSTEQVIEVIDKVVGGITPIGETNYDLGKEQIWRTQYIMPEEW